MPIHELAALGAAICWALTGLLSAGPVAALGPFGFNLIRQGFVTTVQVTVLGGLLSLVVAFALGLARLSTHRWLRWPAACIARCRSLPAPTRAPLPAT